MSPQGLDLGGYRYTAFGETYTDDPAFVAPTGVNVLPIRWKGAWLMYSTGAGTAGAVDLYDMRARWWWPQGGVFLSIDNLQYARTQSTLWAWPNENPIRFSDPFGHDIWIEGPSPGEPAGHYSISVGNPLGSYASYSFGTVVPWFPLLGEVYQDRNQGGEILPGYYIKTNSDEDAEALEYLQLQQHGLSGGVGGFGIYQPANTCRDFSMNAFDALQSLGIGEPSAPPPRYENPGNPSAELPWLAVPTVAPSETTSGNMGPQNLPPDPARGPQPEPAGGF
jgi:RHS repeat-associated protein